jgi:hypothetical protein
VNIKVGQAALSKAGAPRIHAEPADQGIRVDCKRVARLMAVAGIKWVEPPQMGYDHHPGSRGGARRIWSNATSARRRRTSCGFPIAFGTRCRAGRSAPLDGLGR